MTQYKHPTIDDLRHHTEVGTGFTKDAMLNIAADWIEALQAELSASTTTDTVTLSKAEYDAIADVKFTQGYMCAVATLISMHGASTEARELLMAIGKVDLKQIDEYDLNIITKSGLLNNGKATLTPIDQAKEN